MTTIATFAVACFAESVRPLPAARDVVEKLVQRAERAHPTEPKSSEDYYLCTRKTVTEEMDPKGKVTNRKVKVRERRRPSSGALDARKWTAENGVTLDAELLRRFEFTVVRRELLNGRPSLVLTFAPQDPSPPTRKLQDYFLNRTVGTVWVDEDEYEVAKADISLGEPVSFGILGAVHAFSFRFERVRTEDGNWLNSWTDTTVKARKFVLPIRTRKRVDWTDFQRLDAPL
ncbi:MAG: hypothetical protein AB9869_14830 [Verrucomicrobiia bacterium]